MTFASLPRMRLSEPFERLRNASDAILAESSARPKIFLANLGSVADFNERATFAKNFFEAGGIEAKSSDGFSKTTDMAAAFKQSGAKIACLCSSDEIYARDATSAARSLAAAGAKHIYLAGRTRDEAALNAAGVGTFVFGGCDVVAVLTRAYEFIR